MKMETMKTILISLLFGIISCTAQARHNPHKTTINPPTVSFGIYYVSPTKDEKKEKYLRTLLRDAEWKINAEVFWGERSLIFTANFVEPWNLGSILEF